MDAILAISLSELLSLIGVGGIGGIIYNLNKLVQFANAVVFRINNLETTVSSLQKTDRLILDLLKEMQELLNQIQKEHEP